MFNDQREFRDRYIIKKIAKVSQKYNRIMVVMGSGHAIRDREALEQYFDTNAATKNMS
jgi:pheromone shutdown protein TraB